MNIKLIYFTGIILFLTVVSTRLYAQNTRFGEVNYSVHNPSNTLDNILYPQHPALLSLEDGKNSSLLAVEAATCFCSIMVGRGGNKPDLPQGMYPHNIGGREVLLKTQGGYTQGLGKGKCQGFCKGLWASQDLNSLAKQSSIPCGKVPLAVFASIGTSGYEMVNSAVVDLGGKEIWSCPKGQWLHSDGRSCVTGTGCRVEGVPDQQLQGGYFFWKGDLYKITGLAVWNCVK